MDESGICRVSCVAGREESNRTKESNSCQRKKKTSPPPAPRSLWQVPFSTRSALSPATIRASSRFAAEETLLGRRGEGLRSGHHARVGNKLVTKSALLCEVARGRRKCEEAETELQEAQSALSELRTAYHDVVEKNKELEEQCNSRANEIRKLEVQCTESSASVVELEGSVSGLEGERVGCLVGHTAVHNTRMSWKLTRPHHLNPPPADTTAPIPRGKSRGNVRDEEHL